MRRRWFLVVAPLILSVGGLTWHFARGASPAPKAAAPTANQQAVPVTTGVSERKSDSN
jgi:hypothetical protein